MYSNARISKPSTTHAVSRNLRSAVEEFEVGTVAPSHSDFTPNTRMPQRQKSKRLFDSSMKTAYLRHTPEIFQTNPSIVPFSALHQSRQASETSAVTYTPTPHERRSQPKAGTVLELSKHKPVAEHVGATHHQYPSTVVGETLLRQQALLTINSLPTLIARLKADIEDIAQSRRVRQTPPTPEEDVFVDAEEDDLPIPALKQKLTSGKKLPAQPKATYSAAAAGKQK